MPEGGAASPSAHRCRRGEGHREVLDPVDEVRPQAPHRPARRRSGRRSSSWSNITRISMRARLAPRQKWGPPPPKATWGLGSRPMSKPSGSANTVSSRLAEMCQNTTLSPSAIFWSPMTTSAVAWRRKCITGDTKRSISSTADGQQRPVGPEPRPLVGVLEEGQHAARDEVAGRLVAGHGQQHEEQVDLELARAGRRRARPGQHAHQVCVGVEALLLGQLVGVGEQLHRGLGRPSATDLVLRVLAADHPVGPVEDQVAVLLGHAHQVGDDLQGQLGRDRSTKSADPASLTASRISSAAATTFASRSRPSGG